MRINRPEGPYVAFPRHVRQIVDDFAASIGIETHNHDLCSCGFDFPDVGTATLTAVPGAERTVLSLTFQLPFPREGVEEQLFDISQEISPHGTIIIPGLTGRNEVVLAVSVDDAGMSVPALDRCLQRLLAISGEGWRFA